MNKNGKEKDYKITQENISQVRIKAESNAERPEPTGKTDSKESFYEDVNRQSERIQQLVEKIEQCPDPAVRSLLAECMEAVLTLHGDGLERILHLLEGHDGIKQKLYEDDFVNGLLLLHGLQPDDLETRLYRALDKVKPYMDSHGGSVQVVSLENGVATLKLEGSCDGCPSSATTLELGIKEAIEEECPDLVGLEVEGVADNPLANEIKNLNQSGKNGSSPSDQSGWTVLSDLKPLTDGEMQTLEVKDTSLVICQVDGNLYAYGNECPGCGRSFGNGEIEDGQLNCKLGHGFNLQEAGRSPNDPDIHLQPYPLLKEQGQVKVNVG